MRNIEFFDKEHFENDYSRTQPAEGLTHFIDFFWETKFDVLLEQHPEGFSDALFPNIGYTYLVNLGTPFIMQVGNEKYPINKDSYLPRNNKIECFHTTGNRIFGIKFRISPVVFEKKVNFSEYKTMSPLSYLIDKNIIDKLKRGDNFTERVSILNEYFSGIVKRYEGSLKPVAIVSEILDDSYRKNEFSVSIEDLAARHGISSRTLQRYFENATSLGTKQTLQILRVRKAVAQMCLAPADFDYKLYGYYDQSHFHKHVKQFLGNEVVWLIRD